MTCFFRKVFVLLFLKSLLFLGGMIFATVEARKIYETKKCSSLVGRVSDRWIFQDAFTGADASFKSDLAYSDKVTSVDWVRNLTLEENRSLLECPICVTGFVDPAANSNKRDVVLGFGTVKATTRHLFIEALRGVNSQARVFMFVTDASPQVINLHKKLTFDGCGVTIINVGKFSAEYPADVVKHAVFSRFLTLFQREFDRVLLIDFDTAAAQADPFVSYWNSHSFGLSAMTESFNDASELAKAVAVVDSMFQLHTEKGVYSQMVPVSDRIIYGSVQAVLAFYHVIYACDDFKVGEFKASFVAYVNWLLATKAFETVGLQPKVLKVGDDFCSLYWSCEVSYVVTTQHPTPALKFDQEGWKPSIVDINPSVSYVELDERQMCHRKAKTAV